MSGLTEPTKIISVIFGRGLATDPLGNCLIDLPLSGNRTIHNYEN